MLTRAPLKAAAICRGGDAATRSLRATSIYLDPDACGLSILPQARRAGLAGRLTNRSLCRARPHRSAVCCSITIYRGCPQKYRHRKNGCDHSCAAATKDEQCARPEDLAQLHPEAEHECTDQNLCRGGCVRTRRRDCEPATFRECRCKEQGRNINHDELYPLGRCLTCDEQTSMCRGGTKAA